jgi:hypothetical protein
MADASSIVNNGVNVAALVAARDELTKAPAAAQFKWRAACEWKDGTHSHSTSKGFTASGRNSITRKLLPSMLTIRNFLPLKTKVPRRSSTC